MLDATLSNREVSGPRFLRQADAPGGVSRRFRFQHSPAREDGGCFAVLPVRTWLLF